MRQNFSRGKRIDNGEWLYGYYLYKNYHDYKDATFEGHYIAVPDKCFNRAVVPETVGHYTGIYTMEEIQGGDTRCTFIYEGDIVEPVLTGGIHEGFSWGRQVVVFDHGAFCLKDRRGITTPMCNYAASVMFKVLGNIWDNPELMEG